MKLSQWLAILDSKPIEDASHAEGMDRFNIVPAFLCAVNPEIDWGDKPAIEVVVAYSVISAEIQKIRSLPVYKNTAKPKASGDETPIPMPWEYRGRKSIAVIHDLAQAYGWQVEYIENLDAYQAIQLLQEIMLQDQFRREHEYNLSEIAYSYDKGSKKMRHRPMKRPDWMVNMPNVILKKRKIPTAAYPKGNVVTANDLERTD